MNLDHARFSPKRLTRDNWKACQALESLFFATKQVRDKNSMRSNCPLSGSSPRRPRGGGLWKGHASFFEIFNRKELSAGVVLGQ